MYLIIKNMKTRAYREPVINIVNSVLFSVSPIAPTVVNDLLIS